VLASASPARSWLLSSAGLRFSVQASGVDEDDTWGLSPTEEALELAGRKARAVARTLEEDALVLGCDSLLEFEGCSWSKPADADEVVRRWQRMRGKTGLLHTGLRIGGRHSADSIR
jgi:septum formation protein